MSTVEYTIDIFCKDRESVSNLFYVLRRYMYFPHRTYTKTFGGSFHGIDVDRKTNCAYHVYRRAKDKKDIIIYERGNDSDRVGVEWPYEKVNRVRIEFLVETKEFRRQKITCLNDFVKNNKFLHVVNGLIKFKIFHKSKILPKFSQDYNAKDCFGNIESFQETYYQASLGMDNVYQCTKEADFMAPLKRLIVSAIKDFESRWKRRYTAYTSPK